VNCEIRKSIYEDPLTTKLRTQRSEQLVGGRKLGRRSRGLVGGRKVGQRSRGSSEVARGGREAGRRSQGWSDGGRKATIEVVRLRKCRRFHLRMSSGLLRSLLLFRLGFAGSAVWASISDFR